MKRYIFFIFLLLIPLLAWAIVVTIDLPGNWNDGTIWTLGVPADNITQDVVINNNVGTITVQDGDTYFIGSLDMKNDNQLIIESGATLVLGSSSNIKALNAQNASTIDVSGTLIIWGDLTLTNDLSVSITGNMIVHGDYNGGNDAILTINGILDIDGDANAGNNSELQGTGTINLSGACNGPDSFCLGDPLNTDTEPPVISDCPSDITVSLTGADCDEVVGWTEPTASDNNSVESFSRTHIPGSTFPQGTTVVTYTAVDVAGNIDTCSFNVTVNDNTPPVISNCPTTDIVVSLSGAICDEVVVWTAPTPSDNCSIASFNSTHNPGDGFPLGTTVVSYIATDPSGNAVVCTFNVIVNDLTPPVIGSCPTTWDVGTFDVVSQISIVTWQEPTVSDNCSEPTITSNFSSGDGFPPGITKVIYTATDGSGTSATCEFDVDVVGNRAPIASPTVVDVFTGEPIEICLDVRDEDGDALFIEDIDDSTLNGIIEQPSSLENLCFVYTSFDDFEGDELIIITVCDTGEPSACTKVEVRIKVTLDLRLTFYQAFTPDGDNINDFWVIENIHNYPRNQVMIYDRLGGLIFSAQGYNNEDIVWDGRSNQNGQNIMPSGTYFYKIDLGSESPTQKGFIELVN